jgi:para-nitrobenzyl esterase
LCLIVFALCTASLRAQTPAPSPSLVTIDTGKLQGAEANGVLSFKGIPYAAPPVGDLRWRDPQPAKPWTDVRPATAFGPDCIQAGNLPLGGPHSEDCLFINVWRPATAARKLPVMVWIYGGAYLIGGSANHLYDGGHYAEHGVIFVSMNYRLGRFGFFGFPALTAEDPGDVQVNYGIMDSLAALQWVQRNIASFGGDPNNVTLFGESAGGFSVQALMASPLTKGLFQRAIVESGAGSSTAERVNAGIELPRAEAAGVAFAKELGIQGTGAEALAKLRALTVDQVSSGMEGLASATRYEIPTYSGPVVDGKLTTAIPYEVFRKGGGQPVSLIIGATNADRGQVQGDTADAIFKNAFGADAAKAKAAYDPDGNVPVPTLQKEVGRDLFMLQPARGVAKIYSARGLPTYEYRFSYVPVAKQATQKGAGHASELQFVFDHVGGPARPAAPADKAMAADMITYWTNFAKTGDPNSPGLPAWPKYAATSDQLMDFTNEGPKAGPDPWKARLDVTEAAVPHGK